MLRSKSRVQEIFRHLCIVAGERLGMAVPWGSSSSLNREDTPFLFGPKTLQLSSASCLTFASPPVGSYRLDSPIWCNSL